MILARPVVFETKKHLLKVDQSSAGALKILIVKVLQYVVFGLLRVTVKKK